MPELTRRRALGAAAALAATAGTRAVTASADTGHHGGPEAFDEVYRGRRTAGRAVDGGGHAHDHGGGYAVFIDGVELHVMRNADGGWISVVSHYDPVPTPRAAARAAVVELQGAPLVPLNLPQP